jgi:hypothetical protein
METTQIHRRTDIGKLLAARGLLRAAADVGVASGRTALESLRWGFQTVYLVDLWARITGEKMDQVEPDDAQDAVFDECMENLKGYQKQIVVLRGWSHRMADRLDDECLDFVYVDCNHRYEFVKRDLECWYPKLRSAVGTIMSGHDYSNPELGVKQAVDEFAAQLGAKVHVLPGAGEADASFWFEKE